MITSEDSYRRLPAMAVRWLLKGIGSRKCGNRYLAWAWMEAANFAIRFDPDIKRWYQRHKAKKQRLVALKAVAHKLSRAGFHLLCDGGTFDAHRAFA